MSFLRRSCSSPGPTRAPKTGNPFLNLGGLDQAADELVSAMNAESVAGAVADAHPGTEVVVARDFGNSGPSLLFTTTSGTDAEAGAALREIVDKTGPVLDQLQDTASVEEKYRITAMAITFDNHSTVSEKQRLTTSVVVGIGVAVIAVLSTALVDGLSRRRSLATASRPGRRRTKAEADGVDAPVRENSDPEVTEE